MNETISSIYLSIAIPPSHGGDILLSDPLIGGDAKLTNTPYTCLVVNAVSWLENISSEPHFSASPLPVQ